MIGTLQRNKVSQVVGNVVLVHSVDSVKLAQTIGSRARAGSARQDVLLEVNAGEESSKHGVPTTDAMEVARMLLDIRDIRLCGLMTVAPQGDIDAARRAFRALRGLRDALRAEAPGVRELSMGMTEDFEAAIEEGATIVRIGTAIFGPRARPYRANEARREK
jgi:pyridoxal phosphate enzyme (YggS family)